MANDEFFIDADLLTRPSFDWRGPLAIVDLDRVSVTGRSGLWLPACPVIGVGDPTNPLAKKLDLLVEPPFSLETLKQSILSYPLTAGVLVTLLRDLEDLPWARALTRESLVYGLLQGSGEHARWLEQPREKAVALAETVQISRHGRQLDIILDRPKTRNAIDRTMRDALYAAFEIAAQDSDIRRVNLSARGEIFSIGAELGELGASRDPAFSHLLRLQTLPAHQLVRIGHKLNVEIQGACVGVGLEMVAFAKHIAAHKDAWFQLPDLAMGLIPGAGGCVSLTKRIGRQRTAAMILSGQRIDAETALQWGLIDVLMDD